MEVVIQSDEPAKSVSGAEEAIGKHNQHKVNSLSSSTVHFTYNNIPLCSLSGEPVAKNGTCGHSMEVHYDHLSLVVTLHLPTKSSQLDLCIMH